MHQNRTKKQERMFFWETIEYLNRKIWFLVQLGNKIVGKIPWYSLIFIDVSKLKCYEIELLS